MNDREIDAFFDRLHALGEVDLAMLADHPETDELKGARAEANQLARAATRDRFADIIEALRRWATDAGSYPAAGIAAQPMNASELARRTGALPAIHDALLALTAGDRLSRDAADLLRGTWDDVTAARTDQD